MKSSAISPYRECPVRAAGTSPPIGAFVSSFGRICLNPTELMILAKAPQACQKVVVATFLATDPFSSYIREDNSKAGRGYHWDE